MNDEGHRYAALAVPKKAIFSVLFMLRDQPSRGLPHDLAEQEDSDDFQACADRIQADLSAQNADQDAPAFAVFLKLGEGLLRLDFPPPQGLCLLVFTSMWRAADYINVRIPDLCDRAEFFASTARETPNVIRHFRQHAGISSIALDRCPRCDIFACLGAEAMESAEKLIQAWRISLATQFARRDLYWSYARSAARDDKPLTARDVALELVGHVTPVHAPTHFLLGKLAIRLQDRHLLREARSFLDFLGEPAAVQELTVLAKTQDWQF